MLYFENKQDIINVEDGLIDIVDKVIDFTLSEENVKIESEVSLTFMDNKSIREINKKFRNIDRETDVLSFPMLDYDEKKVFSEQYNNFNFDEKYTDDGKLILGDIVLSLEKTKEQSVEFGHSFDREAIYLIVHSLLHLLGYDHIEENDKRRMREREEAILEKFNLSRLNV